MGAPRLTRPNVLAALLAAGLGVAVVMQVQHTHSDGLSELAEEDLVVLLDDVTARSEALTGEVADLEQTREDLQAGSLSEQDAAQAAQERLAQYEVLAGTAPVEGPGVLITVQDPAGALTVTTVLDLLQELRDAGAEAIEIGGVRVVAGTWVGGSPEEGLTLSGEPLRAPHEIRVIGDPHTLATALAIPGGFTDSVRRSGGSTQVEEHPRLTITAVHEPVDPRFARPSPSDED